MTGCNLLQPADHPKAIGDVLTRHAAPLKRFVDLFGHRCLCMWKPQWWVSAVVGGCMMVWLLLALCATNVY